MLMLLLAFSVSFAGPSSCSEEYDMYDDVPKKEYLPGEP